MDDDRNRHDVTVRSDWPTGALADGLYDVRASATDGGGNTSADLATVQVDNTVPTGNLTAPAAAGTVGGTSVALTAGGVADAGGSGIAGVSFEYRAGSSGPFTPAATVTTAPFDSNWDVSSLPSGPYEVEVVVTDNAGNQHVSSVHPITIDSTPPTLSTFAVASALGGTAPLSVSASLDTAIVTYEIRLSGSSTWTQLGSSSTGPGFDAAFDTHPFADGTYDLRATAADQFGNQIASIVSNIAISNGSGRPAAPTAVEVLPEGAAADPQSGTPGVGRSSFLFRVATAPRLRTTARVLMARVLLTGPARVDVTIDEKPYHRIQRWHFPHVKAGATVLRLPLTYPLRPGAYRIYWKATADSDRTAQRLVSPLELGSPLANAHLTPTPLVVVVQGVRAGQAVALPSTHVERLSAEGGLQLRDLPRCLGDRGQRRRLGLAASAELPHDLPADGRGCDLEECRHACAGREARSDQRVERGFGHQDRSTDRERAEALITMPSGVRRPASRAALNRRCLLRARG